MGGTRYEQLYNICQNKDILGALALTSINLKSIVRINCRKHSNSFPLPPKKSISIIKINRQS